MISVSHSFDIAGIFRPLMLYEESGITSDLPKFWPWEAWIIFIIIIGAITQLEVWTPVLRGRYNIPCGELCCVTTKYQAIASCNLQVASFNSGFDLQSWPALLSSAFSRRKQHLSLFYDNLAERWNRPERLELKSKFGYYRYNYFKTSARVEQHTDYGSQS